MSVVVIGSVFVDVKGYPYGSYIAYGRNAGKVEYVHGGVARNIAEDVANMGVPVTFVSLVDESGTASDVIKRLDEHGVDTRYIRRTRDGMGTWLAVFDNNSDVCAAISQRPDLRPLADILGEQGDEIFKNAKSVMIELDTDIETVRLIYALARKYDVDVYAAVANMRLALENRMFLRDTACFVCNRQEAGMLFSEDYEGIEPEKMADILSEKVMDARLNAMVVTLGDKGAVYADMNGGKGYVSAGIVPVTDTTGAGDAFFAGAAVALTYGKTLKEACETGTKLATSVICKPDNTCPQFLPGEFGLEI